tara:strand:- start:1273 stop:2193 length:921 start_codon:yes stop_codon:yes gene_type:complete
MRAKATLQYPSVFQYEGPFSTTFDYQKVDTYNPINNYLLAQLCGLIYQTTVQIRAQIDQWNQDTPSLKLKLVVEDIGSFRFIVVSNEAYIIVCFRGTDSFENWLSDFNIALEPFKNDQQQLVHKGFYNSILAMNDKLNAIILKVRKNGQYIYLTGHSLGGAQAILSGFVCSQLANFTSVTTFGEPKIGNWALTAHLNHSLNSSPPSNKSRIYRNINGMDPVPYLPIFYGLTFYLHEGLYYFFAANVGDEYRIEKTENTLVQSAVTDLPQNQYEILDWSYIHHAITDYIKNAEANKNNLVFENLIPL